MAPASAAANAIRGATNNITPTAVLPFSTPAQPNMAAQPDATADQSTTKTAKNVSSAATVRNGQPV